ncbi:MAG TPA: 2-phospho-L-lactate guanylyltransferase [Candidatus Sulfotelmatobacter sp.]|jgi:2-phospho-L-lactate guanylyltransferase|nr:2-phospho-L-lactate guanylyltransferase [Candidatus Sulfotelmatobacter sp.]
MILVPIKNTGAAKQRLASMLDQPARTKLAQAMLHDVLATLHNWTNRPAVGIVTGDVYATDLAQEYGFEVIPDSENPGETGAIEMATRICVERGEDSTLVIPADIPLIQPWELDEILKHAPSEGSLLVPAGDARGTNAAFRRPANLFPLRFGNDSFRPHHAAAQATGKPCVVLNLPGIAVDVDNPEDLQLLISLPGETRAQKLAREYADAGIFLQERAG